MSKKIDMLVYASFKPKSAYRSFPIDMLRYDCCWPSTESDAQLIQNNNQDYQRQAITVTKRAVNSKPFSYERWESFGWYYVEEGESES